jgi:hypothetical protein
MSGAIAQRQLVNFARADQIELKPVDWLIKGWLVRDTLAALVAPSGAGKSFLAIDWACRIATGAPWYGRDVKQGGVFYLAGEGRQGLRKRIGAWEAFHKQPIAKAPLFIADGLPALADLGTAAEVIRCIQDTAEEMFFDSGSEPELVVIDTLARAMAGADENSTADMGAVIGSLDWMRREWKCTVLLLHHTGHATADRARGSSALYAALDSEFLIKPGDNAFSLKASKCKDWRPPDPLALRWAEVEIAVPNEDPDGPAEVPESSRAIADDQGAVVERSRLDTVLYLAKELQLSEREIVKQTGIAKTTVHRMLKTHASGPPDTG